jgi:hypothetical protein
MVRCLRWSFLLGDVITVGSSLTHLGQVDTQQACLTAAALLVASVSMAWTVGCGILHGLNKAPEILTFADVT